MELPELIKKLQTVSDGYAKKFKINRDTDWYVLKIQEELGELVATYLKLTERGRREGITNSDLNKNLEEEIADVIAMTLLFAAHKGIDVQSAIESKWFKHLRS